MARAAKTLLLHTPWATVALNLVLQADPWGHGRGAHLLSI